MQRSPSPSHPPAPPSPFAEPPAIREATSEDAAAIADVRVRGWQAAYRGQLDDELLDAMSADADTERWRAHLSAPPPGWHGFVAERDDDVVGFVTCGPSRDTGAEDAAGEIYAIYVRPEDVGTGVGRTLLGRAMDALAADGWEEVTLWVLETNTPAHRFYRTAGFEPDGAAKHDELDRFPVEEIRFRRRLRPGQPP
jgi:ribosomal protein S18 acetylase RimI-like enzyme